MHVSYINKSLSQVAGFVNKLTSETIQQPNLQLCKVKHISVLFTVSFLARHFVKLTFSAKD
jgi:hypothetical protein